MALNEQGLNMESSPDSVNRSASVQSDDSWDNTTEKGCFAVFFLFLIPALLLVGFIKSCDAISGDYSSRNIKVLRYHTTDFDPETRKIIYLYWYVLKGDDCYYVYYAHFPVNYSEMQWEKMAAFPDYLSPPSRKRPLGIAPLVIEMQYTLIPLAILPDSIQVNIKSQLEQEYELPDPNNYDEQSEDLNPIYQ